MFIIQPKLRIVESIILFVSVLAREYFLFLNGKSRQNKENSISTN